MTQRSTKTIWQGKLDLLRTRKLPFTVDQYSTLNEHFNVGTIIPPNDGSYPDINYFTIGRGGHSVNLTTGSLTPRVHVCDHATLFEHLPFIMVPTTADLAPTDRAKYRLRVLETYGGIDYFVYYGMVIPAYTDSVQTRLIELSAGQIISDVPYTPSAASLSPAPADLSNTNINIAEGKHIVIQDILPIPLSPTDIQHIIDACATKYGDPTKAVISELGVVSGYSYNNTTTLGGQNVTYSELQSAQIIGFIQSGMDLNLNQPDGLSWQFALSTSLAYPPVILA